jgi:hypothetical protein
MDMAFLTSFWYSFNTLESSLEGGVCLDPSTQFDFELLKVKFSSIELGNSSSGFVCK